MGQIGGRCGGANLFNALKVSHLPIKHWYFKGSEQKLIIIIKKSSAKRKTSKIRSILMLLIRYLI